MKKITVANRQRGRRVDVVALQLFARRALELCLKVQALGRSSLENFGAIEVVLVSDRRIAAIHKRFMEIEGPTDVITFDHGEVVVSVETAARNARAFSSTMHDELRLYLVHGLLHLHGFDDRSRRDAARMSRTQERILASAV